MTCLRQTPKLSQAIPHKKGTTISTKIRAKIRAQISRAQISRAQIKIRAQISRYSYTITLPGYD